MIIRKLTKEKDFEQFAEVSASSFIHNIEETEFEEDFDIFGAFINDGKTLISQMECSFRESIYCKTPLICVGVGGVASKPEYRRLGGVREIFNKVFTYAREKGAHVSILFPFSIGYYRKFGYETIFRYINAECSFKTFEKIERFSQLTLATKEHEDVISDIYNAVALKNNMMFTRKDNSSFCFEPYKESKFTYFYSDGDSKGYVTFIPHRASKTINVEELLFTDKSTLIKLLGFLRMYDGNYDFVCFNKLPVSTPVFSVIGDENNLVKRTLHYGGAGRILDVEAVLKANKYPSCKGRFSLKITDEQIPENNGIYTVEYENGVGTVKKNYDENYDLALDAPAAARILLGGEGLNAEQISYIPNTHVKNDCIDFVNAFPARTTLFYENF